MYSSNMIKHFAIGTLIVATSALAVPAYACGFHGGGFGFGNADWQPYNPRVSTQDPALLNKVTSEASITPLPVGKARPSFSNVANRASFIAKARVAKKMKDLKDKAPEDKLVKKTASNADR